MTVARRSRSPAFSASTKLSVNAAAPLSASLGVAAVFILTFRVASLDAGSAATGRDHHFGDIRGLSRKQRQGIRERRSGDAGHPENET